MKIDLQLLAEIRQLHSDIQDAARTSLAKAIRIGGLLSEIKAGLQHGEWLPWLEANAPFSERTAQNYLKCHDERERLKSANVADLSGAYLLLAQPKKDTLTPAEQARLAELEIRIERGISITLATMAKFVQTCGPDDPLHGQTLNEQSYYAEFPERRADLDEAASFATFMRGIIVGARFNAGGEVSRLELMYLDKITEQVREIETKNAGRHH